MTERDYLTVADVLAMHAALIKRHGGADGLRDPGALEAALFRPQTGYYADLVAEAAAMFESLVMNHPFVDGNKRVAFAAMDVFLRINGHRIERAPMDIYADLMGMFDTRSVNIATLEPWLRSFVVSTR